MTRVTCPSCSSPSITHASMSEIDRLEREPGYQEYGYISYRCESCNKLFQKRATAIPFMTD